MGNRLFAGIEFVPKLYLQGVAHGSVKCCTVVCRSSNISGGLRHHPCNLKVSSIQVQHSAAQLVASAQTLPETAAHHRQRSESCSFPVIGQLVPSAKRVPSVRRILATPLESDAP